MLILPVRRPLLGQWWPPFALALSPFPGRGIVVEVDDEPAGRLLLENYAFWRLELPGLHRCPADPCLRIHAEPELEGPADSRAKQLNSSQLKGRPSMATRGLA